MSTNKISILNQNKFREIKLVWQVIFLFSDVEILGLNKKNN